MKIIYVLVCEKESYLIEQLLLSLYSLKRYNDNEVFIISDRLTSNIIADTLCMQYITDIIVVDVPNEFDTVNRSRFIKTNLRNYVVGDFLFIDIDTVIVQKLPFEKISCEMGLVWDSHCTYQKHPYRDNINQKLVQISATISDEVNMGYFNSGVMYVKDTKNTRDFFTCWHREWLNNRDKGIVIDQPFFVKAQMQNPGLVKNISNLWNCQLRCGVNYLSEAYIIHFLGFKSYSLLSTLHFLQYVRENGLDETVKNAVEEVKSSIPSLHCIVYDDDYYFNCTDEYNEYKKIYKENLSHKKISELFLQKYIKNAHNKLQRRFARLLIYLIKHCL